MRPIFFALSVIVFVAVGSAVKAQQDSGVNEESQCTSSFLPPVTLNKTAYKVGVLVNRGLDAAIEAWTATFTDYLSLVVGSKLEGVTFEFSPVTFNNGVELALNAEIDFVFVNPNLYSCIESEVGANSLVTLINERTVGDISYQLDGFGGVIFTKHDNDQITTLNDLRDKSIVTASFNSLGSGQMQFRALNKAGLHHLQDPSKIIVTNNQNEIVRLVLEGKVDVGFVRTDQLERYQDPSAADGEAFDISRIKLVNEQTNLSVNDGNTEFPFLISTRLYPEWNVASLPWVSDTVARAVQDALLNLEAHALSQTVENAAFSLCDTTPAIALAAARAKTNGKYAGFRTSRSYLAIRDLQESTKFLLTDPITGARQCARASEKMSDVVVCPSGFFKKSDDDIDDSCSDLGEDCYGFQCICSPCQQAFEVDLYVQEVEEGSATQTSVEEFSAAGCGKFEVCGSVKQGNQMLIIAKDNLQRKNANFTIRLGDSESFVESEMVRVATDLTSPVYQYLLETTGKRTGTDILQVFVNGEQIPESPFQIRTVAADCSTYSDRDPDLYGVCQCSNGTASLGDKCVSVFFLTSIIFASSILAIGLLLWWFIRHRRRQADSLWSVDVKDVTFASEPRVLGRGTFGLVLLAEYRGTQVAVKRVLPTSQSKKGSKDPNLSSMFRTKSSSLHRSSSNNKSSMNLKKLKSEFIEEMRLISRLRHPCITTVMGAVVSSNVEPMLIMECMQFGSLYDLLHNESFTLQQGFVPTVLKDITQGIRFLHATNPQIVHSDLKSSNILIDSKFRAKVSDFGLSQKNAFRKQQAGTPFWMAPELLRRESANTTMSDIYSFGIMLYEIFSRQTPYKGEDAVDVLRGVADKSINKRPSVPPGSPPQASELMKACLRSDPSERPTAEDIDIRLRIMEPQDLEPLATSSPLATLATTTQEDWHSTPLANRFPLHVAKALDRGRPVGAEEYPLVTLVHCEVDQFDKIQEQVPIPDLEKMMKALYSQFETSCESHGLFHVPTVLGKSFLAAANLRSGDSISPIEEAAYFALEALEEASETLIPGSKGCLKLRVAIHSGPVTGYVVGEANYYGLMGETVNTVAAMAQAAPRPNEIVCSQETALDLVISCDDLISRPCRGSVAIKGDASLTAYVISREDYFDSSKQKSKQLKLIKSDIAKRKRATVFGPGATIDQLVDDILQ